MGPMGPMMPFWGWSTSGSGPGFVWWIVLLLLVVFSSVVVTMVLSNRDRAPQQPTSPIEVLRLRYARGEIGWQEYREALINLLKDRYVRGELELPQYEERLGKLLEEASAAGAQRN